MYESIRVTVVGGAAAIGGLILTGPAWEVCFGGPGGCRGSNLDMHDSLSYGGLLGGFAGNYRSAQRSELSQNKCGCSAAENE